jgi:hypothetical protein
MGAIFFYIFIYFLGYYGSNILNMLTIRPLVTNRYMAALLPVYGVAFTHAYVIVSSPPPQGTDITVEYALLVFITLPVVIVTLGAAYFMWNSKGSATSKHGDEKHSVIDPPESGKESVEASVIEAGNQKIETPSANIALSDEKSAVKQTQDGKEA